MQEKLKQLITFENSVILVGILISTMNVGVTIALLFI
jgi:hypothetical protein